MWLRSGSRMAHIPHIYQPHIWPTYGPYHPHIWRRMGFCNAFGYGPYHSATYGPHHVEYMAHMWATCIMFIGIGLKPYL